MMKEMKTMVKVKKIATLLNKVEGTRILAATFSILPSETNNQIYTYYHISQPALTTDKLGFFPFNSSLDLKDTFENETTGFEKMADDDFCTLKFRNPVIEIKKLKTIKDAFLVIIVDGIYQINLLFTHYAPAPAFQQALTTSKPSEIAEIGLLLNYGLLGTVKGYNIETKLGNFNGDYSLEEQLYGATYKDYEKKVLIGKLDRDKFNVYFDHSSKTTISIDPKFSNTLKEAILMDNGNDSELVTYDFTMKDSQSTLHLKLSPLAN